MRHSNSVLFTAGHGFYQFAVQRTTVDRSLYYNLLLQPSLAIPDHYFLQGTWLKNALAASTTPWQIVYFHHAAYTSTSRGNSTYMQWPFAQWGADAVISGHDHDYERLSINGIPYFVDGLGGSSLG